MAALDVPWMSSMSASAESRDAQSSTPATGEAPTYAAFSPNSASSLTPRQRTTILVHQKSPLLLATPPQVTRALSYSHPFLLPLNKLVGLLSWTTKDPWESFLLVACFWAIVIYGDVVVRWTGPIVVAVALMMGMYSRRYSPLSTSWTTAEKNTTNHQRRDSDSSITKSSHTNNNVRHHKSLDEMLETLKSFTARCNILLDPFLRLTDFLSTQSTATSATTRPSLTTLFIRILLLTPVWYILTLPPLRIITTKRVVLAFGTTVLTWHARPARVSRAILWRSLFVRRTCVFITGLSFTDTPTGKPSSSTTPDDLNTATAKALATSRASVSQARGPGNLDGQGRTKPEGIRFTFVLFENQRRWLGIGWTASMLAYERAAWTDEELNPTLPKDQFQLPEVDGGMARWQWVEGSKWEVEGAESDEEDQEQDGSTGEKDKGSSTTSDKSSTAASKDKKAKERRPADDGGWIYYDTKWRFPRRGQDGWGKYTRRRKWYRDAELVEIDPGQSGAATPIIVPGDHSATAGAASSPLSKTANGPGGTAVGAAARKKGKPDVGDDASSSPSTPTTAKASNRRSGGWFGRGRGNSNLSTSTTASDTESATGSFTFAVDRDGDDEEDGYVPMPFRGRQGAVEAGWGVGEDVGMELG